MRRPRRARPQLVQLEDRVTPATLYTVSGAGDDNTRDGVLTLREALLAQRGDLTLSAGELAHVAVNAPGLTRDTIGFEPVLGGQTVTFGATDMSVVNRYGATGFVVTTAVTIDGTGGGAGLGVTVSGGNARRLFAVTSTGDLGLTNLTLADGLAQGGAGATGSASSKTGTQFAGGGGGGAAGLGGAVFVDGGVLTITAGTLTGNRAVGGTGGTGGETGTTGSGAGGTGVYLSRGGSGGTGGTVGTGGPGVAGLFGGGGGGGGAMLTTTSPPTFPPPTTTSPPPTTTFTPYPGGPGGFGGGGGASGSGFGFGGGRGGGGAGFGGAVFNNAGTVTISNSTLTANTAVGGAGATAGRGHGGAVFSRNGTLTITSSTLSANAAPFGGSAVFVLADKVLGGTGDTGNTGTAAVTITGSILGQTVSAFTDLATATNGTGATLTAAGSFNLIRNTAVSGVGNLSTADPRLSSLGAFGGPTRTLAVLAGSPALDAGDPAATAADQRGVAVFNGRRDVGAFEQAAAGALTVTGPAALPTRHVGEAYNDTFGATGSAGPFTFAVYGGALPAGLTLSPAGLLSGAPTVAGTFTFAVIAHDPTGASGSRDVTLVVVPAVVLTPTTLPAAALEVAYSQTFTASGPAGPYTFAVTAGTLPAGLTLTAAGALSGMPTAVGAAAFTVTATSAEGYTASRAYTITVGPVVVAVGPASVPAATRGAAYTQAVTATGSTAPYTFAVTAGSLPPGLALAADGTLAGTVPPGATQSYSFTVTATSATGFAGTRAYTLAANSPVVVGPLTFGGSLPGATVGAAYSQLFTATGVAVPFTFAVTSGSLPAGLTLSAGGALAGTPTTAGTETFTVTASSAEGHVGSLAYSLAVAAAPVGPSLTPATLNAATVGVAYGQTVSLTGVSGTITYSVTGGSLPPGLTLSTIGGFGSSAGLLSGTPTAAGIFTFTLRGTPASGTGASRSYTFVVNPVGVTLTPATLPAAAVEAAYAQTLTAVNGTAPYTFAVTAGSLPAGLTLTAAGALAGTPTAAGSVTFTVTATAANGATGTRQYTLTVGPVVVTVGPTTLPAATRGAAYSQAVTASGSAAPYTFAVTAGSLPPGLALAADGSLAGTPGPGATQNFTFTVTATSATGYSGSRAYTLAVNSPVVIGPAAAALPAASQGQSYTQTFTATGAAAPFTFALSAGSLPAGLSLDADGTLAGTPTAGGNFAFTATATSADGHTNSRAYTLSAYATTLVVTSLADDGGPGTLRSVLATANATPGGLPVAVTFAVSGTITLASGPLSLTRAGGPVLLDATGRTVAVDARGASSVLTVAAGVTAELVGLTLKNGSAHTGGGINNAGTLTLTGATLTGNTAAYGGGAVSSTGALTLIRSTLTGNTAQTDAGGAVYVRAGSLTVTDSVVTGNTAYYGGAVYVCTSAVITGSTFANNAASYYGGAFNVAVTGTLTVRTSTLTGNTATVYGGGINAQGTIVVTDSTVTGNSSRTGGGISSEAGESLTGSIVSGNTLSGVGGSHPDVYGGAITGGGYNLLGAALQGIAGGPGNVFTDAPGVAALADNGGPTWTMALLAGSPAVNAGSPADASADQRGVAVQNGRRDIGAFEAGAFLPAAADDAATTAEDGGPIPIDVLANDTPGGGPLAVTAVTQPAAGGTVTLVGGAVAFTPAANFNGTAAFTYSVTDAAGGTASATVVVTVTPVNDPPTAGADALTVAEDAAATVVNVLGNDSANPDTGETLAVTAVAQPGHGAVMLTGGVVRYTPAANYNGSDTFIYTVSDGNGGTATGTVTVAVTAVNDPPTAVNDTLAVAEDAAATVVNVLGNDTTAPDVGETLTVVSVTPAGHGTATLIGGVVRYIPDANYFGPDTFTYTVSDGNGGTATGTASVTVTPVNDPPTANPDSLTVVEDAAATVVGVLANDSAAPDVGETLTVVAVSSAGHGAVTLVGGVVRYVPAANYNGPDTFTYSVSDGNGGMATATVSVAVTAVNDPPTGAADTVTIAEDAPAVVVDVLANDSSAPDVGETLAVASVTPPAHGVVTLVAGVVRYAPAANYVGPDGFSYTLSDGNGGTATGTVTVTVTPVNDPPVAAADDFALDEDAPATVVNVLGNDSSAPDAGEALAVSSVTQPAHGVVTLAGGVVRYAPAANYFGTDGFTYTLSDGNGGLATATVSVTVAPVNDPPTAGTDAVTVGEDGSATVVNVLANDSALPDASEALVATAVTQPAHGVVTLVGGVVRYAPAANYNGPDAFTYTVSDGNGGTATGTVSVTVTAVNDPPTAAADTLTVAEDAAATVVSVLGNDSFLPDAGETLTVTAVTQPSHGAVTLTGGVVRYAPAANYNGPDAFTYTLSDGNGGTATAAVVVTVTPVNDPPAAGADAYGVGRGAITLPVLANDTTAPDTGEPLTVVAVTQPVAGGVAAVAPGGAGVVFTPAPGFVGTATFTYTVSDGSSTTTAAVTVTVPAPTVGVTPVAVGGAPDGSVRLIAPGGIATVVAPFGVTTAPTRTATGDVDGDGVTDVVAVTGPGTPLRVAVLSGADGSVLVAPFDPFGGNFAGGGFVAAGDFDDDGRAEFVVTPDQGGGPRVTVFGRRPDGAVAVRANFLGIDDANFRGGARAAVGDVNGDGVPDLIVAAGFGGGPRSAIFDGGSVLAGAPARLVNDFFAFPGTDATTLRNGAYVAAGDVDGDGHADLVFGGGPGGAPRVLILSGARLAAGHADAAQAAPLANFFVGGDIADRGGARVAVTNADGDGKADVAVGSGAGRPARAWLYPGAGLGGGNPAAIDLDPFDGAVLTDGVYVG